MERGAGDSYASLVDDERFISAVAERVQGSLRKR
jgi:hypothetical protein